MSDHARFAVYYVPEAGPLASFGARWLGWDVLSGRAVAPYDVPALDAITATPRKYGLHGTLKPPFRLAAGRSFTDLCDAVATLAAQTAPARAEALELTRIGRFLALTPRGGDIGRVAGACVTGLDDFRAPAGAAELARRRAAGLSAAQEANLSRWGYPYVLEEFRFHLTLTGKLSEPELAAARAAAQAHLPPLPQPFELSQIALVEERPDGAFELLHRYALSG